MFLALYAADIQIHLPDVMRGEYRNADPYLAQALLAASIAYKRDILEGASSEECAWIKKHFDYIGKILRRHSNLGGMTFKFKEGPAGIICAPPPQENYDTEFRMRRNFFDPFSEPYEHRPAYCGPRNGCWDLFGDYLTSLTTPHTVGKSTTHTFYSIGMGLASADAAFHAKCFCVSQERFNVVTYYGGARTGELVFKDKEWRDLEAPEMKEKVGALHLMDFAAPEMVDPFPLYDRNPLWYMYAKGYRYPKTTGRIVITGHHNGNRHTHHYIPTTYCPYFKTTLRHPLLPWGVVPPLGWMKHAHRGWWRR